MENNIRKQLLFKIKQYGIIQFVREFTPTSLVSFHQFIKKLKVNSFNVLFVFFLCFFYDFFKTLKFRKSKNFKKVKLLFYVPNKNTVNFLIPFLMMVKSTAII